MRPQRGGWQGLKPPEELCSSGREWVCLGRLLWRRRWWRSLRRRGLTRRKCGLSQLCLRLLYCHAFHTAARLTALPLVAGISSARLIDAAVSAGSRALAGIAAARQTFPDVPGKADGLTIV